MIIESGDLIEVEFLISFKNDYEYLMFEDFKVVGFEFVDFCSGYNGNEMGVYMEFCDNWVLFFVCCLVCGDYSLFYCLWVEIFGSFSVFFVWVEVMYVFELKGNLNEWKIFVED